MEKILKNLTNYKSYSIYIGVFLKIQCFKDSTRKEMCRAKEMHPGLGSKRKGPETALLSCKQSKNIPE